MDQPFSEVNDMPMINGESREDLDNPAELYSNSNSKPRLVTASYA
jgi:hypothetical protein